MIDYCPRCDYPQAGLPVEHACPECGLLHDAESVCWRMRVRPEIVAKLALNVAIVAWAALQIFKFRAVVPTVSAAFLMVALALIAWNVRRFANIGRLYNGCALAAITPEGLHIRLLAQTTKLIDWSRIVGTKVRAGRSRPTVIVTYRNVKGRLRHSLLYGMFLLQEDAEQFTAMVNNRMERAKS